MLRLMMLILTLSLSLKSFSQTDTAKITLSNQTAKLVAKDLIKGDGCREELEQTYMKIAKLEERDTQKDSMIVSFGDKTTQKIWAGEWVKGFSTDMQEIARRKLRMLNNSFDIKDLMIPPSNRLEKLKGNRKDFYSIRVNDQWRLIFRWENGNAFNVELIDYH